MVFGRRIKGCGEGVADYVTNKIIFGSGGCIEMEWINFPQDHTFEGNFPFPGEFSLFGGICLKKGLPDYFHAM